MTAPDLGHSQDDMKAYEDYLKSVGEQFGKVKEYMHSSACDKSGFTGLLMILHPAVDLVKSLYDETLKFGQEKMDSTVQGVEKTSNHYAEAEEKITKVFKGVLSSLESSKGSGGGGGR